MEEELKTARQALDAARDRRGELGTQIARLQSDGEHMAETCVQELSVTRHELMADEELPRLAGEELRPGRQRAEGDAHAPGEYGPGEHDGA